MTRPYYKDDQEPIPDLPMRQKALYLLQKGHHLSELEGLRFGLGTSLRTRISELRKEGHNIKDNFVKSENGRRYKCYFMDV